MSVSASVRERECARRERRNLGKVIKPHKSKCGDASSLSAFASASASVSVSVCASASLLLAQLCAPCIVFVAVDVVVVAAFVLLLFPLTLHFHHI